LANNYTYTLQIIQPFAVGIVFTLTYVAEHIIPQRRELIDHKHDVKNMALGIFNTIFVFVVGYYFQQLIQFCNVQQFGLLQWLPVGIWVQLIISFLLIDCFLYWWHRSNHVLPFLWYFHKYHHIDTKMNSTTAVRFHTGELSLSFIAKLALFPMLGISLNAVLLHGLVLLPVIIFHHSNVKISQPVDFLLRRFIVSPRMHRIHHSVIKSETDSNYSSILPFWDKLFKTYNKLPQNPVEFGIK
jgi:sterol desaturase/sphingolipid hydroxylase (fatty acid hydroxylase superfamily)